MCGPVHGKLILLIALELNKKIKSSPYMSDAD